MNIPSSFGPKQWLAVAVIGTILVVCGVLGYVFDQKTAFQAVFVVGVVLSAAGYLFLYLGNRSVCMEESMLADKEDIDGFFYILDEDYSAPAGDATIIDLTRE